MPFLIPAIVQMMSDLVDPIYLDDPMTLIWTISRMGLHPRKSDHARHGNGRVADMINENRRRAYAASQVLHAA